MYSGARALANARRIAPVRCTLGLLADADRRAAQRVASGDSLLVSKMEISSG